MAKPTARTLAIVSMALLGCSSVPSINGRKIEPNTQCAQANLREADLSGAKYNKDTKWPRGFDPVASGAVLVED